MMNKKYAPLTITMTLLVSSHAFTSVPPTAWTNNAANVRTFATSSPYLVDEATTEETAQTAESSCTESYTTQRTELTATASQQRSVPKTTGAAAGGKRPRPAARPQHSQNGIFSPAVLAAKAVMGDEKLNKVRAKAISMHSDVIASFVDTHEWPTGQVALKTLFAIADKNGDGTICQDELNDALQTLGFTWLKEKQIKGIFDRADTDSNGAIDLDEFMKEAPKTLRTNLTKLAKKNGGDLGFLV